MLLMFGISWVITKLRYFITLIKYAHIKYARINFMLYVAKYITERFLIMCSFAEWALKIFVKYTIL